MRTGKMMVLAAVGLMLAMGASAFGGTATISLTTPGSIQVGDENLIDEGAISSPFYIDVIVTSSDALGMVAFGLELTGPATHSIVAAETSPGFVLNYAGLIASLASRGGGFANLGWSQSVSYALEWIGETLPQSGPGADGQIGTINASVGSFAQNGWAAWAQINSDPVAGEVFGAANAFVGDSNFNPMDVTIIPLRITPEPATLSLLALGGLLAARRRR